MMARIAAWGVGLLATIAVPAVAVLLARTHGVETLLTLPPAEMVLVLGLFLPPTVLLLTVAALTQWSELVALRKALHRQSTAFDTRSLATQSLVEECRNQTALLQEQVRLAISGLAAGQRQVETVQHAAIETRM
jgi:Na+/H+-dicarboxylate symporter